MAQPKHNKNNSKQDFQTPPEFLSAVQHRLQIDHFDWDLAASEDNAVTRFADCMNEWTGQFYTEADNSLVQNWDDCGGWCWLNPPFANIEPWVTKAAGSIACVAMLVPASVGANWWRDWVHGKAHVLLLNGRIKFVGAQDVYPRDCALLLYTPMIKGGYETWTWNNQI